jgi:competence protein ComEA
LALVAGPALVAAPAASEAAPAKDETVDLNTATEEELQTLPGVGPALAKRIVEFRKEHGDFTRVEDLLKVQGIGEKSFEKLKARVTVSKRRS